VSRRSLAAGAALAALAVVSAAGCGGERSPQIFDVDSDESIQDAVDRARPGDMVLLAAGVYHEQVEVTTEDIVIRGVERDQVILDGESDLENGIVVRSDGVAVENLTVRNYRANGVLFVGELDQRGASGDSYGAAPDTEQLDGFRASYITAHDNGLYGLYAFAAQRGVFEHSYVSGHADAGVYVGQCKPCDTLVTDIVGERNTIGYQAINASGVTVVSSTWTRNRIGIEVGSQDVERLAPQIGHDIVANSVVDNNNELAPGTPESAFGIGIVVSGGQENRVERNAVTDHSVAGIVVTDIDGFVPASNVVRGNELTDNGVDLVHVNADADQESSATNCFEDNVAQRADPPDLLDGVCAGSTPVGGPLIAPPGPATVTVEPRPAPPQPSRPGGPRDAWTSGRDIDPTVDVDRLDVPET
jgi:hypothetical protein